MLHIYIVHLTKLNCKCKLTLFEVIGHGLEHLFVYNNYNHGSIHYCKPVTASMLLQKDL